MRYRRLTLNPEFFGINVGGDPVGDNASFNNIVLNDTNSQHTAPQQCPFVVGERIGFQRWVAGANASISDFVSASGVPVIKEISTAGAFINIEF